MNALRRALWLCSFRFTTSNNFRSVVFVLVMAGSFVVLVKNYGPSIYERHDFGYGAQRAYEIHKNGLPKTFTPVDFTPPKPSEQELRRQATGSWLWSWWWRISFVVFLYACWSLREEIWRGGERTVSWARGRREAFEDLPDTEKARIGDSMQSFFSPRAWWHDLGREIVWDPIWQGIKTYVLRRR